MKKFFCPLGAGISWLILAGCATPPLSTPARWSGDPVADGPAAMIATARRRTASLWEYRTALAAMHRGDFARAKVCSTMPC